MTEIQLIDCGKIKIKITDGNGKEQWVVRFLTAIESTMYREGWYRGFVTGIVGGIIAILISSLYFMASR